MILYGIFIIVIISNSAAVSGKNCCERILHLNDTSGSFNVSFAHANRTCLQVIPTYDNGGHVTNHNNTMNSPEVPYGVLIEINDFKYSIVDIVAGSLRDSNPAKCLFLLYGKRCDSWDDRQESECHGSVENRTIYRETNVCLEASTSSNSSAIVSYEQLDTYSGYWQKCVDIDEVTTDSHTSPANPLGTTSASVSFSTARDSQEHTTSGVTTGYELHGTLYWLLLPLISATCYFR